MSDESVVEIVHGFVVRHKYRKNIFLARCETPVDYPFIYQADRDATKSLKMLKTLIQDDWEVCPVTVQMRSRA